VIIGSAGLTVSSSEDGKLLLLNTANTYSGGTTLDGGTLTLVTKRHGDRVSIVVENPADADAPRPAGTGTGLTNVARRVAASWGDAGRFLARRTNGAYRVEIDLPARA